MIMPKFKDLTGQKFGRLTVIERDANSKEGKVRWLCRCDCGNFSVVRSKCLINGSTKSCGCLKKEGLHKTHNKCHTKPYAVWCTMKDRCLNPNNKGFKNYGGRGIKIFPEWEHNFQAFYDYVSQLPHFGEEGYSLDRIDNNGNYEPNNLRWADRKTQNRNTRNNIVIEYEGSNMILADVAKKIGIPLSTLSSRYRAGARGEKLLRPVKFPPKIHIR